MRDRLDPALAKWAIGLVLTVGVLWYVRDAHNDARGSRQVACLFVRLVDQGVAAQQRSVATGDAILEKLPKNDPTRAARVKARDGAQAQLEKAVAIAVEARRYIDCPPRPAE